MIRCPICGVQIRDDYSLERDRLAMSFGGLFVLHQKCVDRCKGKLTGEQLAYAEKMSAKWALPSESNPREDIESAIQQAFGQLGVE